MASPAAQPAIDFDGDAGPPERLWLLWARKTSILATMAMVTGAMLLQLSGAPKTYSSSAEVLIRPSAKQGGDDTFQTAANMEPARRMATSEAVRRGARERLSRPGPLPKLSVTAPANSYTLVFSATAPRPEVAQSVVAAYVDSFLAVRYHERLDDLADARQPVEQRLAEVVRETEDVYANLVAAVEPERSSLQTRYNYLLAQRQSLEQQRDALADPPDRQVALVLQPATLPTVPAGPGQLKFLALAVLLGGGLGIAQAVGRSLVTPRLGGRNDLASEAGAPVLALLPRLRHGRKGLVTAWAPESRAADEFHVLSATVLRLIQHGGVRSLLVTSPNRREGKSSTAANLGVSLARSGTPTLLFPIGQGNGLDVYLPAPDDEGTRRDEPPPRGVLLRPVSSVHGLTLVQPDPLQSFLDAATARRVLGQLTQDGSVVIIDGGPVLRAAEILTIAPLVDAVLIVAAADRTSCASLHEACLRLERVGARVVGAVLSDVTTARIWFERRFAREPRVLSANTQSVLSQRAGGGTPGRGPEAETAGTRSA